MDHIVESALATPLPAWTSSASAAPRRSRVAAVAARCAPAWLHRRCARSPFLAVALASAATTVLVMRRVRASEQRGSRQRLEARDRAVRRLLAEARDAAIAGEALLADGNGRAMAAWRHGVHAEARLSAARALAGDAQLQRTADVAPHVVEVRVSALLDRAEREAHGSAREWRADGMSGDPQTAHGRRGRRSGRPSTTARRAVAISPTATVARR